MSNLPTSPTEFFRAEREREKQVRGNRDFVLQALVNRQTVSVPLKRAGQMNKNALRTEPIGSVYDQIERDEFMVASTK